MVDSSFFLVCNSTSRILNRIGKCRPIVERAIRPPTVIENAEIELSLAAPNYKLSLESLVTYRIILNRVPRPTGVQLVRERIGLSSRRQSGKLERQSAKCKHRHRAVHDSCYRSGRLDFNVGRTHRYISGRTVFRN